MKTPFAKSRIFKFAFVLIGVLIVLAMAFVFLQDKIIFQGVPLERNHAFLFDEPFKEHFITTPDGHQLNLLHFTTAQPKGLILYFHGNAGNLQRWGTYAIDFTKLGYEVLMMDYRSYGKSSGKPSEKVLYADARIVWQWAKSNLVIPQLVVYGRSLGTAVASQVAMEAKPELLILETPFDELRGTSLSWLKPIYSILPFDYEFPNYRHLSQIDCRKAIFHGTDDMVTPISSALRLKPLLKEGDDFFVIEKGAHSNLREFAEYHTKLATVLR
jgi:uncharacterized protein